MAKPGEKGFKRIISAARYSLQGIKACWKREAAFRQEAIACIFLLPVALLLGQTGLERAVMVAVCLVVLIVEVLNSGLEAVVDRIGNEHHDLSGIAKDLGSAAVFLSLVLLVVVWGLILLD
ncbi:MAG: diacylglycerol kinase [Pseudohongiellaceae bacterium]